MAFQPHHPLRVAISAHFLKDQNALKVSLKEIETQLINDQRIRIDG